MRDKAKTPDMQLSVEESGTADAAARPVADSAMATWREIDATLVPIVGQQGVAALYNRSLYLAGAGFPYLTAMYESALARGGYDALQAVLAQQTSADAVAANNALLQTFFGLLSSLIGESLTERLLGSILNHDSSGAAAQESSP